MLPSWRLPFLSASFFWVCSAVAIRNNRELPRDDVWVLTFQEMQQWLTLVRKSNMPPHRVYFEAFFLQGGQRWQSIRLLTDGTVLFSSVGLKASISTTDVDNFLGSFSSDNECWYPAQSRWGPTGKYKLRQHQHLPNSSEYDYSGIRIHICEPNNDHIVPPWHFSNSFLGVREDLVLY